MNTHKYFPAQLTIYSTAHFLVDFACACLVVGHLWQTPDSFSAVILYNFCAFALQMPIGIIADKLNLNALLSALGSLLVGLGFIVYTATQSALLAAAVSGVGNALFHMGAGIDVLNASKDKSGPLGIFVSPGAFGLFLGIWWSKLGASPFFTPIALTFGAFLVILLFQQLSFGTFQSNNVQFTLQVHLKPHLSHYWPAVFAALFFVVLLRSYVGTTLSFTWKQQWYWAWILTAALVLGKALGGILSDKFGMKQTSTISLLASAVCFLFPATPIIGVLAVFLFNMTMPMTLWSLSQVLNHSRGFAFGTLTLALFFGWILDVLLSWSPPLEFSSTIAAVTSLILLLSALQALPNSKC